MTDEEPIFEALAQRMNNVLWVSMVADQSSEPTGFVTSSRRVKLFNAVPAEQQPACFQAEHANTEGQVSGMPYKTTLEATWLIYQCLAKDGDIEATIENNKIMKAVRQALAPFPTDVGFPDHRNTLGSLVYHCMISGRVIKDPGDIDGQGMIIVPIKLLVP